MSKETNFVSQQYIDTRVKALRAEVADLEAKILELDLKRRDAFEKNVGTLANDVAAGNHTHTGLEGPEGPEGPIGPKGDTGLIGSTGIKGDKGDIGNTGNTGSDGTTGSQGIQGIQGPDGDDAGITVGPDSSYLGTSNGVNYPLRGYSGGDVPEGWRLSKMKLIRFDGDSTIYGIPLYEAENQPVLPIIFPE